MTFSRIAVGVDGSANAERALNAAVDLARRYDAGLILVHAVMAGPLPRHLLEWARVEHLLEGESAGSGQPVTGVAPGYGHLGVITHDERPDVPHAARLAVGRAIVEHARSQIRNAGLAEPHMLIEDGDPAKVLERAIDSANADLVVVGSRGLGTFEGLMLGSVSHKVVGLKRCPCLTVP